MDELIKINSTDFSRMISILIEKTWYKTSRKKIVPSGYKLFLSKKIGFLSESTKFCIYVYSKWRRFIPSPMYGLI